MIKGRGAGGNPEGRFAAESRAAEPAEWMEWDDPLPPLSTTVQAETARSIISRNDSPDIPFEQSINPYRGCEHGCIYCVDAETPVLCADGRHRPIADLRPGDRIIGTRRYGHYRHYVETEVTDKWDSLKPAFHVTLADGTRLIASGDHRFLTERGWKFVTGAEQGRKRRPHLTTNNKLMGIGAFAPPPVHCDDYKRGYLTGIIRGDGAIGSYRYNNPRRRMRIESFRLVLKDEEALLRARAFLRDVGIETRKFEFKNAAGDGAALPGIRTHAHASVAEVRAIIDWPDEASEAWRKGFLAGIFDAEGSYSGGVWRLSNTDFAIIGHLLAGLDAFGFNYRLEYPRLPQGRGPITVVRLLGGLQSVVRLMQMTDPAITRKRKIAGTAVRSDAALQVVSIESLGEVRRMCDVSTGTGDFVANGVIAHNCYARPSHAYMDLSPGLDFETRLFYKADAARLLEDALRKPGYVCTPIAFGTNTDPYQPIEKRLRVTRSLLELLSACRHPLTIVTKGTLVLRDLDLLQALSAQDLVRVYVSITSLDAPLKRRLEPRAASPQARLATVRTLADAGVPVGVMIAPVIPAVTDHELESIVAASAEAGATSVAWQMLRLPFEVSGLFRVWLQEHFPDRAAHVMSLMQQIRGGRDNDPRFGHRMRGNGAFAALIGHRFKVAVRKAGLEGAGRQPLRTDLFRPPVRAGDQGALF